MYHASVTLHLLAALLWLGGLFFLAVVGAPVLRAVEPPALRAELFRRLGLRFRAVAWVAIAILLGTGVANLGFRGLLASDRMGTLAFWTTSYGQLLGVKLVCVVAMLVLSAVHDFALGPAASREPRGTPRGAALRRWTTWVARINVGLGVLLVAAAVRVARG